MPQSIRAAQLAEMRITWRGGVRPAAARVPRFAMPPRSPAAPAEFRADQSPTCSTRSPPQPSGRARRRTSSGAGFLRAACFLVTIRRSSGFQSPRGPRPGRPCRCSTRCRAAGAPRGGRLGRARQRLQVSDQLRGRAALKLRPDRAARGLREQCSEASLSSICAGCEAHAVGLGAAGAEPSALQRGFTCAAWSARAEARTMRAVISAIFYAVFGAHGCRRSDQECCRIGGLRRRVTAGALRFDQSEERALAVLRRTRDRFDQRGVRRVVARAQLSEAGSSMRSR